MHILRKATLSCNGITSRYQRIQPRIQPGPKGCLALLIVCVKTSQYNNSNTKKLVGWPQGLSKPIVTHKILGLDHYTQIPLIPTHATLKHKICDVFSGGVSNPWEGSTCISGWISPSYVKRLSKHPKHLYFPGKKPEVCACFFFLLS